MGWALACALFCAAAQAQPSVAAAELRFSDFYRRPIGPRGLEPSARLLALDGQAVHIVGYMAALADAPPGLLILAPLPVSLGDEDESFADDLPASAVYVHLADGRAGVAPLHGLLSLSGRLQLGARPEADGRVSFVRLWIDEETSRALLAAHPTTLEMPHVPSR